MSLYAHFIAKKLGLSDEEQELILNAAQMHDVGKIGIPDSILLKPGKLTMEEFETMKGHAKIGFEILSVRDNDILKAGREIAISHHEKNGMEAAIQTAYQASRYRYLAESRQ